MLILRARYSSSEAFLKAYQPQFLHGGLFAATRSKRLPGTPLLIEVRFPQLKNALVLRGIVAWRRPPQAGGQLRAGLGIEFPASERHKRDFLLAVARGESQQKSKRRHRRLPVQLQIDWREKDERQRHQSLVGDIGEGGAFIKTIQLLPVGRSLILDLVPPGAERGVPLEGRVAWTHHAPGEEGMGIAFRCRDRGGARRLRELVRRIEDSDRSDLMRFSR
jgi:Tfp pilus assembly protein PilZ